MMAVVWVPVIEMKGNKRLEQSSAKKKQLEGWVSKMR